MATSDELTVLPIITMQSYKVQVITWTVTFDRDGISKYSGPLESRQFRYRGSMWKICIDLSTPSRYTEMKCYIKRVDSSNQVKVGYIILALDSIGEILYSWSQSPTDEAENQKPSSPNMFELPERLISGGFFTLCCQLTPDQTYFVKQLELLDSEQSTDLTITVGKRQLKAHSFMLAAHSSVFREVLNTDKQSNRLRVSEFDFDVIKEMLTYIYLKRLPNLDQLADGMLRIADRYDVHELKSRCEASLCGNVSAINVVKLQALAEHHNLRVLKEKTKEYIQSNIVVILETQDWKNVLRRYAADLFHRKDTHNVDHIEKDDPTPKKKLKSNNH